MGLLEKAGKSSRLTWHQHFVRRPKSPPSTVLYLSSSCIAVDRATSRAPFWKALAACFLRMALLQLKSADTLQPGPEAANACFGLIQATLQCAPDTIFHSNYILDYSGGPTAEKFASPVVLCPLRKAPE